MHSARLARLFVCRLSPRHSLYLWPSRTFFCGNRTLPLTDRGRSFLAGFSPEEAELLFNGLVYEKLGYFEYYNKSCTFLSSTFKQFGANIEPWLDKWKASGCFMHSINHPKIYVICDLALIACSIMGIETRCDDGRLEIVPDNLVIEPQIPLYPEIAQRIGNGCKGHTLFKLYNDAEHTNFRLLDSPAIFALLL